MATAAETQKPTGRLRRKWLGGLVLVAIFLPSLQRVAKLLSAVALIWLWATWVTEFKSPLEQLLMLGRRACGYSHVLTRREMETSNALFYLHYAFRYEPKPNDDANAEATLPATWEELLPTVGPKNAIHQSIPLWDFRPLLREPNDPWGNPWMFQIYKNQRPYMNDEGEWEQRYEVQYLIGSGGRDGIKTPLIDFLKSRQVSCAASSREGFDDLAFHVELMSVPESKVPATAVPYPID